MLLPLHPPPRTPACVFAAPARLGSQPSNQAAPRAGAGGTPPQPPAAPGAAAAALLPLQPSALGAGAALQLLQPSAPGSTPAAAAPWCACAVSQAGGLYGVLVILVLISSRKVAGVSTLVLARMMSRPCSLDSWWITRISDLGGGDTGDEGAGGGC